MPKQILLIILFLLFPNNAWAASFTDVDAADWYYHDIKEMQQTGWLTGYEDGSFRPNEAISAAEFVSICTRAANQNVEQANSGHWAANIMANALQSGWYDWDELPPTGEKFDQPIQRQLAVKILMQALLPGQSGDYVTQSQKIRDFSQLDGRYYNAVLAAYAAGVTGGDNSGFFHPHESLSRAEACAMILRAKRAAGQQGLSPTPIQLNFQLSNEGKRIPAQQGPVSANGRLKVVGTELCNENGEPIVLRGMSSHGIQWYSQFTTASAIANTAAYGANVFRVAMYTEEGGYISNPQLVNQVIAAVEAAIDNDMYVIIDWHILSDGNPMQHLQEAKSFFAAMSKRYRNVPNVIYEICNEPNGNISWATDVKPYAEAVIAAIRAEDTNAVILIGSPTWSQDVHLVAQNPISGSNLMYTCHFYAGTHGEALRQRIAEALLQGLPIFVSEWGCSSADGSNGVYLNEAAAWLQFLTEHNISWCNWSLCDKNETSAALKPGTSPAEKWSENNLTESGRFVFSHFKD